jgi:hypothetical protein
LSAVERAETVSVVSEPFAEAQRSTSPGTRASMVVEVPLARRTTAAEGKQVLSGAAAGGGDGKVTGEMLAAWALVVTPLVVVVVGMLVTVTPRTLDAVCGGRREGGCKLRCEVRSEVRREVRRSCDGRRDGR